MPCWHDLEPALMASTQSPPSTALASADKLTFPYEPTSDETPSSPTRAPSTSTIKREEKEKPKHNDSGQDGIPSAGRRRMTGASWMAGRMAGRMAR